jgi:peroxiredoxin
MQAVLVFAVYWAVSAWRGASLVGAGGAAPAFQLPDTTGEIVDLRSLRGKRVLLHFWATWCGVCKLEIPSLKNLSANLDDDEALVTIVHPSTDLDEVRKFLREQGIQYPVVVGNREVFSRYGVTSFPTNYFLTPAGDVSSATTGMSSRWSLIARMAFAR